MLGPKIEALMRLKDWNLEQTAEAVRAQGAANVKYQYIQQLLDNPNRVPRYLIELAAAFGMTAEQLKEWKIGTPVPQAPKPKPLRRIRLYDDPSELPEDQYVMFRRIETHLAAGPEGPAPDDIEEHDIGASFRAGYAAKKGWKQSTHFTMRVDGHSMEPTIQDRAPVVIATNEKAIRSGRVYAIKLSPDSQPILKRLDKLPGGKVRVRSDNPSPEFAPFEVEESAIDVVGRAVWTPVEL